MTANADGRIFRQGALLREIWVPGVILSSVAILLRIMVASRREGIEVDGITYLMNAQAMLQGWAGVNILHPPLYSMVLALFSGLWSDPEWGARVISAVAGGLWVWPTLWLARETTDERVAWSSGLLVALMPAAVEASTRVLPEALYGLCLTTLLASFAHALRTGSLHAASLVGILGGLATLTRPEGMGYLFLAWGLLVLAPMFIGKHWTMRLALTKILAITVLWLLVVFPYMLAVKAQTGSLSWSGKIGITLHWAESVGQDRPNAFVERVHTETRDEDLRQGLLAYVMAKPGDVLRRIAINLHLMDKYTLPVLLHSGGIALVMLGIVHLRFRRGQAPPEWFLAMVPLPLAGLLLFVVEPRYFVPIIPALSIIAGIGLARVGHIEESQNPRRYSMKGMLLLTFVLLSFLPWIARPWFRQDPSAVQKASGLWLRQSAGAGTTFLGRYPVIGYYAEARGIPFARRSLDDLLIEARTTGAMFLIVDNVLLPESRPDLLSLVAGDFERRGVELAHVEEDRAGHRVVIYRLKEE